MLPDVWELFAYWDDYPPIDVCVRAYLGVKPKGKKQGRIGVVDGDTLTDVERQEMAAAYVRPWDQLPKHIKNVLLEHEINKAES